MAFDPITAGIELGKSITGLLTKWIPDTAARDQASAEIAMQVNSLIAGQIALNQADAVSPNKFVAYWRPAVGWICAASFAYIIIGRNILNWIFTFSGLLAGHSLPLLPEADATIVMEVLFGMLGLGGMRTFEKFKGVTK